MTRNSAIDVIFLDMDGVLLPFGDKVQVVRSPTDKLFPDHTLAALTLILTEQPDVAIVLTSTWRVREDFRSEIIDNFQAYGKQHGGPLATIEKFHDYTDIYDHSERQWEIQAWLATQTNVRAWVALDDEELLQGKCNEKYRQDFMGHVIKTNSEVGLTTADAQQAISLLRQQIQCIEGNRQK